MGSFNSRRLSFGLARLFSWQRSRSATQRLPAAPLAPQRLERRRVLDAGAAELLLGCLAETGEYVQTGTQPGERFAPTIDTLSISPVDEFQFARLIGTYSAAGSKETADLDIDWDGDHVFDQTVEVSGGSFEVFRQFLDDDPTATSSDTFSVNVQLRDDDTGADVDSAELTVNNVAPSQPNLFRLEGPINEGEATRVLLSFRDPGILDSHTIEIDWGDDTEAETIDVPSGGSRIFLLFHVYSDDIPTASPSDVNQVQVTITDDDGGQSTAVLPILVSNVAPTIDTLSITSPIDEGQFATLTGTFSDPGTQDTFELDIDWDGDLTFDQTVEVHGGEFQVARQFLDDNPSGTLIDTFDVNVRLRDDDTGVDTGSVSLTVSDVSPFNIQIEPVDRIDENGIATIEVSFEDPGSLDTHFARINWGDGSDLETIEIDRGERFLVATHQYLDDDPTGTPSDSFLIRVGIINDDLGRNRATAEVLVRNVDPLLTVTVDQTVDEGALLDLTGGRLGSFVDVGTRDTHTSTVNWGDGTATETVTVNQGNGSGTLDASHRYADNGVYTVRVSLSDDDSGLVTRTFQIQVNNVAPTLILNDLVLEINEGDTLDLPDLGTFSDPGFGNPFNLNDPTNGGEVEEFFEYTIDWGDGSPTDTFSLHGTTEFGSVVDGSLGQDTTGILDLAVEEARRHRYLDNDEDNHYTIKVTLSDDDGGSDTEEIDVKVNNINPVLETIAQEDATDVNTKGETSLIITFSDIGADELTIWVDWGDIRDPANPFSRGAIPFVVDIPTNIAGPIEGPGTYTVTLAHTYVGAPNPLSPAADIDIFVVVVDDDFSIVAAGARVDGPLAGQPVFEPGRSALRMATISNPGIGTTPIVIDTTPQVPRLIFPQQEESAFFVGSSSGVGGGVQTTDLRTAVGDTKSTTDRFLELRVIDPASGEQSEGYRLKPEVLNDLPGLFKTLPDNRYAIYLVRTETNTRRLVIEVYVRNGKLIDPGDDSEGTRDRPPTDTAADAATEERTEEATEEPKLESQPDDSPILKPAQSDVSAIKTPAGKTPAGTTPPGSPPGTLATIFVGTAADRSANAARPETDQAEFVHSGGHPAAMLLGTAAVGLAASKSAHSWAERISRAVATADSQQWHRLRRRQSSNRK